ncbi:MAG: Zn-ribbon domain-containing OB-fold protein [Burkholderiaceae bacterium]|nr:Zn-ribbon domain-containing OB-fold protein [Burkholderiaceae bacterium]
MTIKERKLVAPTVYPETQAFWDAAREGRLLVKQCEDCGEHHHYPRAACPFCGSLRTQWHQASGRGTIYSFSVMRRAEVPYVIAYVTLEEGPTMMSNIIDADFDAVHIGQSVTVRFQASDGGPPLPVFAPA